MENDFDSFQGEDLTKRPPFGKWQVIGFVGRRTAESKNTYWKCRCTCGVEREVAASHLTSGRSQSCGHRETTMRPAEQPVVEGPKGRKRRNNRLVEYQGQQMCVTDFAEAIGQRRALVFKRLNAGWTVTQIVGAPDPAR